MWHKTENFPCVQRNELGSNHPPSSVSFSDVSSQIGLSERQCEVRTSPNACFHNTQQTKEWIRGVFALQKLPIVLHPVYLQVGATDRDDI